MIGGDCATSQTKTDASRFEILLNPFKKLAIEELLEIYLHKEKTIIDPTCRDKCSPCEIQGDSDCKRLKLSCDGNLTDIVKPEWVWLQGHAGNVSEDLDTFHISDNPNPTGSSKYPISLKYSVLVVNCLKAPSGITSSTKGSYYQGE